MGSQKQRSAEGATSTARLRNVDTNSHSEHSILQSEKQPEWQDLPYGMYKVVATILDFRRGREFAIIYKDLAGTLRAMEASAREQFGEGFHPGLL